MYELDHIFLTTAPGAPVADALVRVGFSEGSGRHHIGQGTANRRFFFRNSYLEFLWLVDAEDSCTGMDRTRLVERCTESPDVCPFGIALRKPAPNAGPIFSCWHYHPPYLPADVSIPTATNSEDLMEPLLFISPSQHRPDQADSVEPLKHAIGGHTIAAVVVSLREAQEQSAALQTVAALDGVVVQYRNDWLLDVIINGLNLTVDLRPSAPLRLRPS